MKLELARGAYKSIREHIIDTLRNAILSGELPSGRRITEVDLANQLGTSRAPVREALRQLEKEGFVDILPYRETRVSTITDRELREVLVPIRITLELFALKHLQQNLGDGRITQLERTVNEMRSAAEDNDRFDVIEKDLEFHRILMQTPSFTHPMRLWTSITPVIYRAFIIGTTPSTLAETVVGHERLLEAIRSGSEDTAERVLREHIEEMESKFSTSNIAQTEVERHEE